MARARFHAARVKTGKAQCGICLPLFPQERTFNRRLQDRFDSRRISDRLEEKQTRTTFTDDDKAFIESTPYFFLATADAEGRPDCSFKGGMPGFVCVTGPSELAFPDYDGNGMFKSLGNVLVNSHVGILFACARI